MKLKKGSITELEREVDIMSGLSHPNIIRLFSALKTENNLYIFTDYRDEGDLKGFIKKIYK